MTTPPNEKLSAPLTVRQRLATFWSTYRRPLYFGVGLIGALSIGWYLYDAAIHEETDDAYITGHLHYVSSRVAGVVSEVHVNDNEKVVAGQVLVQLDPTDNQVMELAAKATLGKAQADLDRETPLLTQSAVTAQQIDAARQTRDVDLAALTYAQLQVKYTTISAPANGRVARKNVEIGNRVQAGQTLLVVVEPEVWVVANFKETQLTHMHVGQSVEIRVDRLPGRVFTGKIDSFAPGSGNQFALLPADNSTGNFTKVVQRVPVKIVFDPDSIKDFFDQLSPGLSAVVKVRVR